MRLKTIFAAALLCSSVLVAQSFAQNDDYDEDENEWINNVPPISYWGLRGLTQTTSAEPLGMGRLNFSLFYANFKQEQEGLQLKRPFKGSSVQTFSGVISWGLNDHVDIFGVLPLFILSGSDSLPNSKSSFGELMGGIHFSIPIPDEIPLKLAVTLYEIQGIRSGDWNKRDVTTNLLYWRDGGSDHRGPNDPYWNDEKDRPEENLSYAGYDYFDARANNSLDLIIRLSQSLVAGNLRRAAKLHLNEGFVITPGYTYDVLFLGSAGAEIDPTEFMTIGAEINWRTPIDRMSFKDPLWVTPSVMFRSSYYTGGLVGVSLVLGADFRLSQPTTVEEKNSSGVTEPKDYYPLEKQRFFGDLIFSLDLFASKRKEMKREARRSAAEKARLKKQAELTLAEKDSIARKAHEDSLRLSSEMADRARADSLRAKYVADSLAAIMGDLAAKARQDSIDAANAAAAQSRMSAQQLADAEKRRLADSLANAQTNADLQRRLAEEKAKRSEAEQQMLSTGMLVLDGVFFVSGKSEIQLNSRGYLTTLAKMLVKYPKLRIEVGGHTDNVGKLETNMALSQQRAAAVVMFMHGIDPSLSQMFVPKGYGPTMPKADNNTAAGREVNRRVELKVLNPDILREYNP